MTEGLHALEARLRRDLEMIDLGARNGAPPCSHPSGEPVLDVAIVGGGQNGLGAAFALRRTGLRNILVLDENPAGQEGPWETFARMVTLRTPKALTSIDLGVPALTFRAWWEAQHGEDGWAALDKIARSDWMAYLRWYRRVLGLPVVNSARVEAVLPEAPGLFRLKLSGAGAPSSEILARKVVLATGIKGCGEWHVPKFIASALPSHLYAHTVQSIDFAALKGKRVGILGAGASAFDNAYRALEAGAAAAEVFLRRREMPRVNLVRHMETAGLVDYFAGLDDAAKYAAIVSYLDRAMPPTVDTFSRAAAYPGFALHPGEPWQAVRPEGEGVAVTTPQGDYRFDYLIVSTGAVTDLRRAPELAAVVDDIALWRDRYSPPPGTPPSRAGDFPYLGKGFEYVGRTEEGARRLHGLFGFNYAALVSQGVSSGALTGLRTALPRLADAVRTQLLLDDGATLLQAYLDYNEPEFTSPWPQD